MSDVRILDATGSKFTQRRWNEFCSYIKSEDDKVSIQIESAEQGDFAEAIRFVELKAFLETEEFAQLLDAYENCSIALCITDVRFVTNTNDVKWWTRNKNGTFPRLDKLFSEVKLNCADEKASLENKPKTVNRSRIIKVAAGIQSGGEICELDMFEGSHADAVAFVNKYYAKAQIRSFFKDVVKFVFDYEQEEQLVISTSWKTLDELEAEGKIICA